MLIGSGCVHLRSPKITLARRSGTGRSARCGRCDEPLHDCVTVEGRDGAQVDHGGFDAVDSQPLGGLQTPVNADAHAGQRHVVAVAAHRGATELDRFDHIGHLAEATVGGDQRGEVDRVA